MNEQDKLLNAGVARLSAMEFAPIRKLDAAATEVFSRYYGDHAIFANGELTTGKRIMWINQDGYAHCPTDKDGKLTIVGDEFKTEFVEAKMTLRLV